MQVSKQQQQEQLWGVHCHAAVECGHPQLRERPEGSEAQSSSEAFVNASWGFNGFHRAVWGFGVRALWGASFRSLGFQGPDLGLS